MFVTVLLVIAAILSIYYYLIRNYNYWRLRKVSGPEPQLIFGNTKDVTLLKTTTGESLQEIYKMYEGLPYVGIYELRTPALLLRDPQIIKHILVKDFNYFQGESLPLLFLSEIKKCIKFLNQYEQSVWQNSQRIARKASHLFPRSFANGCSLVIVSVSHLPKAKGSRCKKHRQ